MANKITKREVINAMLANEVVSGNTDWVNYLENELALLDRKASNKKATKTQEENVSYKAEIMAVLTHEGATVTEIQSKSEVLGGLSNQRVSALLRQLVGSGEVVKTIDKKKSFFALA
jgi:Fic family protein